MTYKGLIFKNGRTDHIIRILRNTYISKKKI